jgi:hypothetical protein
MPDLEGRHYACAEGLTEVDGPLWWVPELREGRVGGEAALAGAAGVAAAGPVAAVARRNQDRHPGVDVSGRRDWVGALGGCIGESVPTVG